MDNLSQPDCNRSLSDDARKQLVAIFSSGGFAGVLSCFTALALLLFFKMYKHFSERLSMYMLLSGLLVASVISFTIVGIPLDFAHHHGLCQAIGFLVQYSIWTLLLLTTFVSFHLASLVLFHKMFGKLEPFYILFALLFPLLFSWIPFIHDTYGLAGAWCWIRAFDHDDCSSYQEGLIEQYVLWYGPLFVILISNFAVVVAVSMVLCYRAFRKKAGRGVTNPVVESEKAEKAKAVTFQESISDAPNEEARQYKKALKKTLPLLAYPIIFNVTSWFALANRIRRAVSPGSNQHAVWVVHAVAAPTWAFFVGVTFIIYVIAKKNLTKQNIKKAARSWKRTLTRMRKSNVPFQVATANQPGTDVLTTEGYTVTSPTTWEPDRESEFEDVSCSIHDDDAQ